MRKKLNFLLIFLFILVGGSLNNMLAEEEVKSIKGFQGSWVNPTADFKTYEVILIDKVDVSEIKAKGKVDKEDIDGLADQLQERFYKTLNNVMPTVFDKEKAADKKAMNISLKLKDAASTGVGINAALQVVSFISRIPLPTPSVEGSISFEADISDLSNGEKLITVSDESKSDKNASLAGTEGLSKWKHAYNTMDYWADCLAALLAEKRGQEYKSQLKFKAI